MEKIQFKCTLISDIVLNQFSATEGKSRTLDFIPGNNFLGIVASQLYKKEDLPTYELFHSGKVRFGDAHPSNKGNRGLHVPACIFKPKLKEEVGNWYIHHFIDINDENIKSLQLKQCREGYYIFDDNKCKAIDINIKKNFTIKSAYDANKRRSEDKKMFGYEALCKGLTLYFDIEIENELLGYKENIVNALCGIKHIGRSRTAEYGLVKIEKDTFKEVSSNTINNGETIITVYADGRLIFLDKNGIPTFNITAKDLGIEAEGTEIDWTLSQVRTFQYAPWNYKRQSYDTDRCGFEKGTVLIVKCNTILHGSRYVGSYQNEGFGKIIYNPIFLSQGKNGKAIYQLSKKEKDENREELNSEESDAKTPLIAFLNKQKKSNEDYINSLKKVNEFVKNNAIIFRQDVFASQWSSIRNLAMGFSDGETLKQNIENYLKHGIAKDKWMDKNRKKILMAFIDEMIKQNKETVQDTIINLSSEMAKICKMKK